MTRQFKYAVSPEDVDDNLAGLLEYENNIIEIDKGKQDLYKFLNTKCPICQAISDDCYKCVAEEPYFNSCIVVRKLRRQFIQKEISTNELLMKLWEQVVLTREWIWDNWK